MTREVAPPFAAPPSRLEGALAGTLGFGAYLLLAPALGEGRSVIGMGFLLNFAAVLRICWPLRKKAWFWLTVVALAALHVLAIAQYDWSVAAAWTGVTLVPLMMAHCAAVLMVIYLIYRSIYGIPSQLGEDEPGPRYSDVNRD